MQYNKSEPFGYKMSWIVVNSKNPDMVIQKLNLRDIKEVTWKEGIDAIYNSELNLNYAFVTPEVNGWIFVVSQALPSTENNFSYINIILNLLSAEFNEAQSFSTHRVSEYHHWIKSVSGKVVRSFAIAELEILSNTGEPTPGESHCNFDEINKFASGEMEEDFDDSNLPDEETVMQVAENWSINPTRLEDFNSDQKGFLAILPESLLPAPVVSPESSKKNSPGFFKKI